MDLCDTIQSMRAFFFAKDRDVVLQASRVFEGLGMCPIGLIIIWSGAIVDIPTGWQLCNGTNGTPDLRDQFIVGAGTTYAVGATGGSATVNLAHTHASANYTTDNDTHDHHRGDAGDSIICNTEVQGPTDTDTHNHTVDAGLTDSSLDAATENRPLYYALAFIQRLT